MEKGAASLLDVVPDETSPANDLPDLGKSNQHTSLTGQDYGHTLKIPYASSA